MLVERLLPVAHERLIAIAEDAAVIEAAGHLSAPHTYLLVVCDRAGRMVGVMSKLDVVKHISRCSGHACTIAVSSVMTRNVITCRPNDWLRDVWAVMKDRYLHCIPVLGVDMKPLGTLYARDVLQALLTEVEDEEVLLRDYACLSGSTDRKFHSRKTSRRSLVTERAEGSVHLTRAEHDPRARHEATAALA